MGTEEIREPEGDAVPAFLDMSKFHLESEGQLEDSIGGSMLTDIILDQHKAQAVIFYASNEQWHAPDSAADDAGTYRLDEFLTPKYLLAFIIKEDGSGNWYFLSLPAHIQSLQNEGKGHPYESDGDWVML